MADTNGMIECNCPQCVKYYILSPETAGRKAKCERCACKFYIREESWGKTVLAELPVSNTTICLPPVPRLEHRERRTRGPLNQLELVPDRSEFAPQDDNEFDFNQDPPTEWWES